MFFIAVLGAPSFGSDNLDTFDIKLDMKIVALDIKLVENFSKIVST